MTKQNRFCYVIGSHFTIKRFCYIIGSQFTIMSCFYFYQQLIWLDVVKLTSLRDSSYLAPYSLLVRQSQAIFLGVKW